MSVFDKYSPIDQSQGGGSVFSKYQPVAPTENPVVAGAKYSLPGKVLKVLGKYNGSGECVGGAEEIVGNTLAPRNTYDQKMALVDPNIKEPLPGMTAVMPAGKPGHLGVVMEVRGNDVLIYDVNSDGHNTKMLRLVPKDKISGYQPIDETKMDTEKFNKIKFEVGQTNTPHEDTMAQAAQKGVDEFSQKKVEDAVKSEKEDGGAMGAAKAAGDKLNTQLNSLGDTGADMLVNWADKPYLERVGSILKAPLTLGANIAKFAGKTAVDIGKAVASIPGSYTDAVKGAGRTTKEAIKNPNPILSKEFWQTPSEPLPENVSQSADLSKKAVMEASAFLPTPTGQLASGFANEFDKSIKAGLPANQALGRASLQGGEQALATWALKKLTQKGTAQEQLDDMVKEAKKAGLTERQVNKVINSELSTDEKMAYLQQSIDYNKGVSDVRPTDLVGKELADAQGEISAKATEFGKRIGEITDDMKLNKGKVPTGGIMDDAMKKLSELNIKVKKSGKLDFNGSDLEGMSSAQSFVNDTWDKIRYGSMDAREAVALARNIGNKQFAGGVDLKGASPFANIVRKGLRSSVDEFAQANGNPDLANVNAGYHDMLDMQSALESKITESGVKGGELVRRSVSNAGAVPQETFSNLDSIAKKYGLKSGGGIWDKANVAQAAENSAGIVPEQSIQGIGQRTGQQLISSNPKVGLLKIVDNAMGSGVNWLGKKLGMAPKTGSQVFENIVRNPPKNPSLLQSSAIGAFASGKGASAPAIPEYQRKPDEWQSSKANLMSPLIPPMTQAQPATATIKPPLEAFVPKLPITPIPKKPSASAKVGSLSDIIGNIKKPILPIKQKAVSSYTS